jgi:RNA recognition motif-containing protein
VEERIYVGNLPFKTTDDELKRIFEPFGSVQEANVIRYKQSGRSKGYAFVVMDDNEAKKAIDNLNEFEYQERILKVRSAKPRNNYPKKKESKSRPQSIRIGID